MKKPVYVPGGRRTTTAQSEVAQEEQERNEFIGEKYNSVFDQLMKRAKQRLINNLGDSNQSVFNKEFERAA